MSTKIYNGKKIKKEYIEDVDKFSLLVSSLKKESLKKVDDYISDSIRYMINNLIVYRLLDNEFKENIYSYMIDIDVEIKEKKIDEELFFNFIKKINLDSNCDKIFFHRLYLYPYKNYYFCYENERNIQINYSKYKFKEYSYYNNTDKPENITEKNWSKREKEWNKALSEKAIFIDCINEGAIKTIINEKLELINKENLNLFVQDDVSLILYEYFYQKLYEKDETLKYQKYRENFKEGLYQKEFEDLKNEYKFLKENTDLNILKKYKFSYDGENICISK